MWNLAMYLKRKIKFCTAKHKVNCWVSRVFRGGSIVGPLCLENSGPDRFVGMWGAPSLGSIEHPSARLFACSVPFGTLVQIPVPSPKWVSGLIGCTIWEIFPKTISLLKDTHEGMVCLELHSFCQKMILPQLLNIWCKICAVKSPHLQLKYFCSAG